jgi:hypothetical protein
VVKLPPKLRSNALIVLIILLLLVLAPIVVLYWAYVAIKLGGAGKPPARFRA